MVVIIDYKMGNISSVEKAFKKIGADILISDSAEIIGKADRIVLPGVGAFGDGMKNLQDLGLIDVLEKKILKDKIPFLGICLGMQLLFQAGHEFGTHKGLGWVEGEVVRLEAGKLRIPHIGWNNIRILNNEDVLLKGIPDDNFYFVHSYYAACKDTSVVSSVCNYGQDFVSSICKENIFATQFHPEKSQVSGLKLLDNFLNYA